MEFKEIIQSHFVWGLALGLLIAAFILKNAIGAKMQLKREIRRAESEARELQSHLNTQMKITATGNETLTKEVSALKESNENLRVNFATLQSKPDKNEQRQFRVYEMAISTMREQAPGFAGAWEKAIRQAESEMASAESGFSKLVRRVVPGLGYSGSRPTATEPQVIESHVDPT